MEIESSISNLNNIESLTGKLKYCEEAFEEYKGNRSTMLNIPQAIYKSCIKPFIKGNEKEYNAFINDLHQRKHFDFLKVRFEKVLSKALNKERVINDEVENVKSYIQTKGLEVIKKYEYGNINDTLHPFYGNETECLGRELYYLPFLNALLKAIKPQQSTTTNDYKKYLWFKIGLLFAVGEPQELYKKYKKEKGHFKKITLELGFKETDRPFFSETLNNSTESEKNIYSNQSNLLKIQVHCINENIPMCEDFLKQIRPQ